MLAGSSAGEGGWCVTLAGCGKTILARENFDDLHVLIAKRAYELYGERGYRDGSALDDWLDAEREIFSQIPPV